MARAKSEFVSASGTANEIIKRLANAVYDNDGSDDDLRRILSDDQLADDLARMIVKQAVTEWTGQVYKLIVKPMPWSDRLAAGKFDWVHDAFTEVNFPMSVESEVEQELMLLHLNRYAETNEVEAEMKRLGLEPADDADLVTFGAANPELQRQFPIVALGSRARDSSSCVVVPVLVRCGSLRDLNLSYCGHGWRGGFRFLCRRKSAAKAAV